MRSIRVFPVLAIAFFVSGCGKSESELDTDTTAIPVCSAEAVEPYRILGISTDDEVRICQHMSNTVNYYVTASNLRYLSHAAYVYVQAGWTANPVDAAYSLLTVIKLRGQTATEDMTRSNLSMLRKIYAGTENRIGPQDIVYMLQSSGKMAHTLSDQGIIDLAAYMSIKRKRTSG